MTNKVIPTHDPHTGELNPYYEELTGEKNPLLPESDEFEYCFNLSSLIGKEFRYRGNYGLSNWTDKVKNVEPIMGISGDWHTSKKPMDFQIYGHTVSLRVRSTRGNQLYELENCVFVNY
jgi:hypothetical protein